MQQQGIVMPGYKVYEYKLILNPHEDLRERISSIREDFNKNYKIEAGLKSTPNLAIVNFMQFAMKEEAIMRRLKTIAMGTQPFKVEIKDYGSFPAHTIYLNVISKLQVQALVSEVRTQAQALMKLNAETKPHFLQEPHITIGMKLKPWQYEKAWLEYSRKSFTSRFIADEMLLLKREPKQHWQIAGRFEFQNLPVLTKQGDLFA